MLPLTTQIVQSPVDIPDRTGGGCLQNGPFADLSTFLGPKNNTSKRPDRNCVRRDLAPASLRKMSGKDRVAEAMDLPDYGHWERTTDGVSLHPGGHWGPGGLYGTMTDLFASPADPVFWLHHSNLDRAW